MKTISETHPSLSNYLLDEGEFGGLDSFEDGQYLHKDDVQRQTIDKAVLKEKIKEIAKKELLESIDWEVELFKELGFEEEEW